MTLKRREIIVAAAEEKLPRVGRCRADLTVDLRLGHAVEPHCGPPAMSCQHDMIPGPRRQHRLADQEVIPLVAVKQDQSTRNFRVCRAADAEVVSHCLGIAPRPA